MDDRWEFMEIMSCDVSSGSILLTYTFTLATVVKLLITQESSRVL